MGKLQDLLNQQGTLDSIEQAWEAATPAPDDDVLPAGTYIADIIRGDANVSKSNQTPGYQLTFEVVEGDQAGRKFWHDCWLTEAAMPRARRDLGKLGVTEFVQLEKPLPAIYRCEVKLTVRRDDDGGQSNRVRNFKVIAARRMEPDPFAPRPTLVKNEKILSHEQAEVNNRPFVASTESDGDPSTGEQRSAIKRVKKKVKKRSVKNQQRDANIDLEGQPNE